MLKANDSHITNLDEGQISILAERFKKLIKLNNYNNNLLEVVDNLGGKISYDNLGNWKDTQMASLRVDTLSNSSEYKNYVIIHELGHYALHSELGAKNLEFLLYGDNTLEDKTSLFSYNLLMPSNLFNKLDKSIVAIAICFNVLLHIVKIKIADLG